MRIVIRPVNESEPHKVPDHESAAPAPEAAPSSPQGGGDAGGASSASGDAPSGDASPGDAAPGGATSGERPAGSDPAPSSGEDAGGHDAGGGDATGDDTGGGDESSGEGEGGDERKKRRRRRRRRRKEAVDGEVAADGAAPDGANEQRGNEQRGNDQARNDQGRHDRGSDSSKPSRNRGGRNKQKAERAPRDKRRGGKDSQHSATQAVRALADMAHALLRVEGVDALAMPRYLELNLRVPLDGGNDVRHAASTAVEQILQRVREVREHEAALRPGAVYSYFADSSHAEGCRPTEPRHVFDGYSSTGKPNFADFVTLAIERKDPEIERLLAGEEIVLTHVTMGRVLRTQQLAEFGGQSPVFKILGQVNAGLFRVLNDAGRCAFSFQLLRGSTLEGRVRLRLHPVGAVDPMDLADPALMQILTRFQRKLDQEALRLEGKLKNGDVDEEEFVLPLLQDFARQLQTRTRNAGRRTQHGLERSEGGQRPTSKAYPDAGEASDGDILWDVDQSTVVVLGPKGRVHVFTPHGKHVTSVVMQRQAVERRKQQGRWRLAEPEERGEFRIHVKRLVASGEDQTVAEPAPGAAPQGRPQEPGE